MVLICDDSVSTRDLTTGWLRSEGYHVLEAGTGAEALLVMSEHRRRRGPRRAPAGHQRPRPLRQHQGRRAHVRSPGAARVGGRGRAAGRRGRRLLVGTIRPYELLSTVRSLLCTPVTRRDAERLASRLDRLSPASLRINVALSPAQVAQEAATALVSLSDLVEEQDTAITVQRSLLPATLPPLPGLTVAARHQPSGSAVEVGGDFFDTFQTDDGRSVVVVGDVQGHSLQAAIVMAELRYSLRRTSTTAIRQPRSSTG